MAQTGRQRGDPEPPCSSFNLSQVEGLCALQSVVGKPMRLCGPQQSVPRLTVTEASTALSLCVVLALSPGLLPLCCGLAETQAMSCSHDPLFFTVTNGAAATSSWHTCDREGDYTTCHSRPSLRGYHGDPVRGSFHGPYIWWENLAENPAPAYRQARGGHTRACAPVFFFLFLMKWVLLYL